MPKTTFKILEEADVPVPELVEDPRNANRHNAENLAAIEASLKAFGQPERLVTRKSDRVVFSGNGRLTCMRKLGWKTARIQFVQGTDQQCRAYALAANQTTRLSKFDPTELFNQLEEIHQADLTGLFDATGFSLEDLEDMRHLHDEEMNKIASKGMPAGEGGNLAVCPKCHNEFRIGGTK